MKLVNRKTRKAIDKTVRKALKKQGPALMAALAGGLASSLATLAKTEAPGTDGKSNLATMAERVAEVLTPDAAHADAGQKHHGGKKKHHHKHKHKHDHDRELAAQTQPSLT